MPTRNVIESREAAESARIVALREAAQIGIADIETGRFRKFVSPAALRKHLESLTGRAERLR